MGAGGGIEAAFFFLFSFTMLVEISLSPIVCYEILLGWEL